MNKDKMMAIIKKKSVETGVSVNTLLLVFFFEDFLTRLASSKYNTDMILKGGFLLSSILGVETRTTMDMDISLQNRSMDENSIRKAIQDIIDSSNDKEIDYEIESIVEIKKTDEYPGYRVSLIAHIENIKQSFSIDIATGDHITPGAIDYRYRSVFNDENEIKLLSYNLETIIAEKLETMVSKNTGNGRSKDFYDIYTILKLKGSDIDKNELKNAILNTFKKRGTAFELADVLVDLDEIASDPGINKRWDIYCKRNSYVDTIDLQSVIQFIKECLIVIYEVKS